MLANFIDPNFVVEVAEAQKAAAIEAGKYSNEQIQQQYDGTVNYFWVTYPMILIFSIIIGLVTGLVLGLILKKVSRPFKKHYF